MEGKNAFGGQNNHFQTPRGQLSTSEQLNRRRSWHEAQIMKTSRVQGEQSIGMGFPCSKLLVIGAYTTQSSNILGLSSWIMLFPIHQRLQSNGRGVWTVLIGGHFFWLYTPVFQRTQAPCNWSRSCSACSLYQVDVFHHSLSGGSGCLMYQGWANVVANQWCIIIF